MTIGYFGKDIIFETSSEKVLTFNDFKHSTSVVIEKHKIIGKKPLSEYCGQELDNVTFTINLNAGLGVKPLDIIDKLHELSGTGTAEPLVIGGKVIGLDKFLLNDVSTAYETVYNNGFLYSAKVDLTLEEYISDSSLNTTKTAASTISSGGEKTSGYYSVPSVDSNAAINTINIIGDTYNLMNNNEGMYPFMNEINEDLY